MGPRTPTPLSTHTHTHAHTHTHTHTHPPPPPHTLTTHSQTSPARFSLDRYPAVCDTRRISNSGDAAVASRLHVTRDCVDVSLCLRRGQNWALYIVVAVILVAMMSGLILTTPCSLVGVARVRVLLIAVSWWSVIAALGLHAGWWATMAEPLGTGSAVVIAVWSIVTVRTGASHAVILPLLRLPPT